MNRVEVLRKYIDKILLNMNDDELRRAAYVHLYGVAQNCTLIALKRNESVELSTMAGMLHDIYTYAKMDSKDHAHKGASLANEILAELNITTPDESKIICNAIYCHSDKENVHNGIAEVLIDADVMQHCLYNTSFDVMPHEKKRYEELTKEFQLG